MNPNFYQIDDDLLMKYLLEEANSEERTAVENWLAAAEGNKLYFRQLQLLWEQSKALASTKTVDENIAWQRFRDRVRHESPAVEAKKRDSIAWWRIAALFILIIGAALFAYKWLNKEEPIHQIAVSAQASTLIDTLPDGSVITLNKNAELSYPSQFNSDSRSIALKGEAFFEVVPDKKKPFMVQVNDVTIRVLGTSFNVRSENGITEVIVETGVVQVTRGNRTVELRPKEKLTIKSQDSVLVKEAEIEQLHNYYRTKEFVCDNTPLWRLVEVLNEAYDSTIIIDRPALRNLPISTTFSNESLDQILNVISLTFNINVIRTKDTIRLR
ncbi:MAG TPA: FecR domain-containing protein [Flavisolibacter sp.]|nr:FecR domain-containing protein [Flavisolibacter sp.]